MKELAIIAKGKNTCLAFQEQLNGLLKNRVSIKAYYIDGNIKFNIKADLGIVTSPHILSEASRYIGSECPTIVARRSINYHEVQQLLEIPAGTNVLLVNDVPSTAYETIALLKALGIDHINYHPYVPGLKDYPQLKIAVTPGEVDLVPDFVEKIVDIKSRIIDITTVVEILDKLGILDEHANLLSATYIKEIINLIKKSRQIAFASDKIKNQLQTIINTVHDGIIATDDFQHITVFNPIAENLLGVRAKDIISKNIDFITDKKFLQIFNESEEKETFIRLKNHNVIVNVAEIFQNNQQAGKVYTFKDVSEIQRLEEELRRKLVRQQNIARYTLEQIQGQSEIIQSTLTTARKMAASPSPILIQGESGTGKELFAQGLHNASPRKNGPFIAVNFASLTESLLESELFGYEEGSFTGARRGGQAGLFEQAHKGTIFLDEIGDASLPSQVKILRVLQEKQVRRIGSSKIMPIDVRVIAATNCDLKDLIAKGLFRQDLYYRLNVLPIKLPPLKARKQDILLLGKTFYCNYFNNKPELPADEYFKFVAPYLLAYQWPGNIRELQNVLEYLMNLCPSESPKPDSLPEELINSNIISTDDTSQQNLRSQVLREIEQANYHGKPIGRRSLSVALNLPENTIRGVLNSLQKDGLIIINKGRKGLQALKESRGRFL